MKPLLIQFSFVCMVLLIAQSCAPVFSELQSARMAGDGRVELTPHYSNTSIASEGESEGVQNQLGLQLATGITPKLDFRFRYENVWLKGDGIGDGLSLVAFGPKVSLVQDRMAFYAPIGTAIGKDVKDAWEFQPTVFFTLPVLPQKIDFTVAPKYVMVFCKECNDYFAFNTSLAISSDVTRWALRPEFGLLFAEEESVVSQFSLGLSFQLGKRQ